MARFSFSEARQIAEKEYGLESGGYFKVKEGANKMRLLSETVGHQDYFKGEKKFRYVCWVFDYADQKVKLYFMPSTIHKAIESLQLSEDYTFDEVPMPYDLTINVKNAGTKEVDYQVMPARSNSPLPATAEEQLANKGTIHDVLKKINENKTGGTEKQPVEGYVPAENVPVSSEEINLGDINF